MSANEGLVAAAIPTFQELIRRNVNRFVQRCLKFRNNWIKSFVNSNSFCLSKYYEYYNRTLLMQSVNKCVACTYVPLALI